MTSETLNDEREAIHYEKFMEQFDRLTPEQIGLLSDINCRADGDGLVVMKNHLDEDGQCYFLWV